MYKFSGVLQAEIADLRQYQPDGKMYREKGSKPLRMSMEELSLFAYYTKTKLQGEWLESREYTHIFSNAFACMNDMGVRLRKYFLREGDLLPGVPNVLLSPMQWNALVNGMEDILKQLYGQNMPTACFIDKKADHSDGEHFVPCHLCAPFLD